MDKRDHVCVQDLGLVGCPMGSQGTMGLSRSPSGHSTAKLDNYESMERKDQERIITILKGGKRKT